MSVLKIDLDKLVSGSYRVHGDVAEEELELAESDEFVFSGPVHLDARLSTNDQRVFYLSGGISYEAAGECRRCLAPVSREVESGIRAVYAYPGAMEKLAPTEEERESEEDVFMIEDGQDEIDLSRVVRESIVLEYPRFLQCSEECKGLCPECGADLNRTSCDCGGESLDPRWSKLRELKKDK